MNNDFRSQSSALFFLAIISFISLIAAVWGFFSGNYGVMIIGGLLGWILLPLILLLASSLKNEKEQNKPLENFEKHESSKEKNTSKNSEKRETAINKLTEKLAQGEITEETYNKAVKQLEQDSIDSTN